MAGIYLHIPFCKQACYYCDFHFSTNQELRSEFVDALVHEVVLQRSYLGSDPVSTIYLGGGTPSLLPEPDLQRILNCLRENFAVSPAAEITLEANPDDLTLPLLTSLRKMGINRLSIGIQSFQPDILRSFNRAHSAEQASNCVPLAREAGFANISIDLIYGAPGQSFTDWQSDVQKALALAPEHLSAYALTIEENTVFGRWQKKQKLVATADEQVALQFEYLMEELGRNGYEHYEISNFCQPGFLSKHNSAYWLGEKYLGLGPSAHSFQGTSRQFNIANNALYIKSLQAGQVPFTLEPLSDSERINELIYTGLRTQWGFNNDQIVTLFGFDVLEHRKQVLDRLANEGWLTIDAPVVSLLPKGKLLADQIASDLFTDDAELGSLKKSL
jgi:oxygen-independent coproporphyrinogen-3 oxidase